MLDEDDQDEETKELRDAWLCPTGSLLEGARTRLVEPTPLFSVRFVITGMIGWAWGWRVIAFTQDGGVCTRSCGSGRLSSGSSKASCATSAWSAERSRCPT